MKSSFVIFAGSDPQLAHLQGEQVKVLTLPRANDPSDWAKAVASSLSELAYDGSGVLLAVPSIWCLSARISIADLPKRNRRQLMIYRLEEHFPSAAEDLAVDFTESLNEAMGVGVAVSRLAPLVDALELEGIAIQSIVPTALLVAAGIEAKDADVIAWRSGGEIEILVLNHRNVVQWSSESDLDGTIRQLQHAGLCRDAHIRALAAGFDANDLKILGEKSGITFKTLEDSVPENVEVRDSSAEVRALAARHGALILAGTRRPWIELRRDGLAPAEPLRQIQTPLNWMMAAICLFGICSAGSMLLRAHSFSQQVQRFEVVERQVYQDALGKSPVGANIKARLMSEDRRLQALSGILGNNEAGIEDNGSRIPRSRSALLLLDDTLKSLPHDLRYRLLDLRFSAEGLQLEGQTRTHSDADAIADGLRSVGGYAVEPPHSQARTQDKGVDFTIAAKFVESPTVKQNLR